MVSLNATHDPKRRSWVASANAPDTEFPIQNLPFGIFRTAQGGARGGVAIGDQIVDLKAAVAAGLFTGEAEKAAKAASGETLNALMALGNGPASALRAQLSDLLREDGPQRAKIEAMAKQLLVPMKDAELLLPATVRQFTDFCISTFHAGRLGLGFDERGNPKTQPMFKYLPVAYHGRASSVVVSGAPVRRPNGEWRRKPEDTMPTFGAEPWQDIELELGCWFGGQGNALGEPIPIADAAAHVFGYCLVNDWSARAIQFFESMLGPFLGKNQATTISPWIVTAEAMAPFMTHAYQRPEGDPESMPHLYDAKDQEEGHLDLALSALIQTDKMRKEGDAPVSICETNFKYMYWTWAQMVAHHASNGCDLAAGDLYGSGTCSGPGDEMQACLAEKSKRATKAWSLPNGESRTYLEDGDDVNLKARATRAGYVSIGFGDCAGKITPAPAWPGNR